MYSHAISFVTENGKSGNCASRQVRFEPASIHNHWDVTIATSRKFPLNETRGDLVQVSLLEEAILGIQESAAAAEASDTLRQQAFDDSSAADAAEALAEQLQEEHGYALREAEAAERVAEELAGDGRTTESMTSAATAGRCSCGTFTAVIP